MNRELITEEYLLSLGFEEILHWPMGKSWSIQVKDAEFEEMPEFISLNFEKGNGTDDRCWDCFLRRKNYPARGFDVTYLRHGLLYTYQVDNFLKLYEDDYTL